MIVVDTNALVRFLTKDIPSQAHLVSMLLEGDETVFIPDVVFPELEYVLCGQYEVSRDTFINGCRTLILQPNIQTSEVIHKALVLFAASSFDMADCIIASSVGEEDSLASFDKKLVRTTGKAFWKKERALN